MNNLRQPGYLQRSIWSISLVIIALLFLRPSEVPGQTNVTTGGGTINKIPKWTASATLGDSVVTESSGGSIGIGTTTPVSKLEVAGDMRGKASAPAFYLYDTSGPVDARQFYFWNTGGLIVGRWVNDANSAVVAEAITFKNNGNVGIGTTSPNTLLDIQQSSSGSAIVGRIWNTNSAANSDAALRVVSSANANGNPRIEFTDLFGFNASIRGNGSTGLTFRTGNEAGAESSLNERMRIDPSGNVGINTTSPQAFLHVGAGSTAPSTSGGILTGYFSRAGTTDIEVKDSTNNVGTIVLSYSGGGQLGTITNHSLAVLTNNTARMTIDTSGNVGIGTSTPQAQLDVVGNVNVSGNIAAKYQDVAEWVLSASAISAGTVVILDPEQSNQVTASSRAYDTRVAGVVSTSPGVILGEGGEGKVMVATTGRVRVKVDATTAPIRVGDLLVTSDKEGIAMRSQPLDLGGTPIHRPGTLIGKALEPLDKGVGEILVLLSLQ